MQYTEPLLEGVLLRRYKRFLADVRLADGTELTAHTPNTGSMLGCSEPGSRVWLRDSANPKRKYRYSWELVETAGGTLVGINTGLPHTLVREAVADGTVTELQGYASCRAEVRYGQGSRIDLLYEDGPDGGRCYVEIKNVTTCDEAGYGFFPDAVSARGTRHLRELMAVAAAGDRAVLLFCVQRGDVERVRGADEIDPLYARTLEEAVAAGVEVLAYRARVRPEGVRLERALPVPPRGRRPAECG